jgi:hypothetical protein
LNISKGGELGGGNLKWTEELLKKEALKYNKRSDFKKYSRGAYESAREKKILDYICLHMKIKWTEKLLIEESLKHKSRYEFLKNGRGAYMASKRRGILDKVCSHMS